MSKVKSYRLLLCLGVQTLYPRFVSVVFKDGECVVTPNGGDEKKSYFFPLPDKDEKTFIMSCAPVFVYAMLEGSFVYEDVKIIDFKEE